MSRFATLLDDGSDSDASSTAGKRELQTIELVTVPSQQQEGSSVPKQSGGTYAQRSDPMTGVDWGKAGAPVDTGFSAEDVEACVRVVSGLGGVMLVEQSQPFVLILQCPFR